MNYKKYSFPTEILHLGGKFKIDEFRKEPSEKGLCITKGEANTISRAESYELKEGRANSDPSSSLFNN